MPINGFVELMVAHHQGGLHMAEYAAARGGERRGAEPTPVDRHRPAGTRSSSCRTAWTAHLEVFRVSIKEIFFFFFFFFFFYLSETLTALTPERRRDPLVGLSCRGEGAPVCCWRAPWPRPSSGCGAADRSPASSTESALWSRQTADAATPIDAPDRPEDRADRSQAAPASPRPTPRLRLPPGRTAPGAATDPPPCRRRRPSRSR